MATNPSVAQQPDPSPEAAVLPSAPPAVRTTDLTKSYGDFEAVKGISFEIRAGEVFGLLGPNGAGKTTTISVLSTQLRASGGRVEVFEHGIDEDIAAVRRTLGVVPQEIAIYPALTAAENVRFFGQMYGVAARDLTPRVDSLLELVGLHGRANDRAENFSGGMKRRLNLAVSLVHQPRLLLLDEPTAGVDPHSRERIFSIVRDLRNKGTAILYTTHYMEEAESLCDRLGVMDEGQIIAMGTLDDLLARMGSSETVRLRGISSNEVTARLGSHPAVTEITAEGNTTRLFVTRSAEILGALQQLLERHPQASLQVTPMSLGDLFLHLTGKELRD